MLTVFRCTSRAASICARSDLTLLLDFLFVTSALESNFAEPRVSVSAALRATLKPSMTDLARAASSAAFLAWSAFASLTALHGFARALPAAAAAVAAPLRVFMHALFALIHDISGPHSIAWYGNEKDPNFITLLTSLHTGLHGFIWQGSLDSTEASMSASGLMPAMKRSIVSSSCAAQAVMARARMNNFIAMPEALSVKGPH